MTAACSAKPFLLNGALLKGVGRPLELLIERLTGLHRLQLAYEQLPRGLSVDRFVAEALRWLQVRPVVGAQELARVPKEAGAIVVANHPFGAVEGLLLANVLRRQRQDVRFLANGLLSRIPELAGLFIEVDVFGGRAARKRNAAGMREAVRWVRQGGLLVVFPAGEVSHLQLGRRAIEDPAWHPSVGRIIKLTGAPVVPAYLPGCNSLGFQLAGLFHPRLRTMLLPRELLNKAGRDLPIRFGRPVQAERLGTLEPEQLMELLRMRCYALAAQDAEPGLESARQQPIPQSGDPTVLAAEVAALPPRARLLDSGDLSVFCAEAEQIPLLLQEIGRLRELTFRAVGEGTGRARDLDLYDNYYRHLFIWNRDTQEVVGAYRLAETDRVVARFGITGLYTHSLFRFGHPLVSRLNPAVELGRSFVRPEYQRAHAPLLLLWKGIGAYVAANPHYKVLFGPVSISADYAEASRQLLVDYLSKYESLPELARLVKPRRPHKRPARQRVALVPPREAERVSRLIEQIELDGKGMPVLLRQYLKLGGKVLGFNVDADFANVLDGLIMVDLSLTEEKVLSRYMGREGARAFLARHRACDRERAAG